MFPVTNKTIRLKVKSINYLVKRNNKAKIWSIELSRMSIVISIFSFLFLSFASDTYALSWQDKEWEEAGCPKSGIGKWKSNGSNIENDKIMIIEKNRVSIIANNKFEEQFLYKESSSHIKSEFIQLILKTVDEEKQMYIKIRPHLISSLEGARDFKENPFNCFIKVFQYDSPKDIKFDKYLKWDIFQLKNTN
jgi:hypothetical protein